MKLQGEAKVAEMETYGRCVESRLIRIFPIHDRFYKAPPTLFRDGTLGGRRITGRKASGATGSSSGAGAEIVISATSVWFPRFLRLKERTSAGTGGLWPPCWSRCLLGHATRASAYIVHRKGYLVRAALKCRLNILEQPLVRYFPNEWLSLSRVLQG